MRPLSGNPASTYRRIDLDARIEAASGAELTRICLEEAIAALGLALQALGRNPDVVPREPLARAQGIALWLARGVDAGHPMRGALVQFYGGIASGIGANLRACRAEDVARLRGDLQDLLDAA